MVDSRKYNNRDGVNFGIVPTTDVTPSWYKEDNKEKEERKITRLSEDMTQITEEKKEERTVSVHDIKLKEFILLCDQLGQVITDLNRVRDKVYVNSQYTSFGRSLVEMRDKAIVESYTRGELVWKQ